MPAASTTPARDAARTATPASGGTQLQLVSFEVAGEEFAVDILSVQEINRMTSITRVPQSPAQVEGVINLRGRIIPILDLRRQFRMPAGDRTEQNRIVVVEVSGRVLGFVVDRVHEVLRISSSIVEPAPEMASSISADFISGVAKLEDRLIILLDLERLFSAETLKAVANAAAA
jgi:purine-binding chemotaxis protein CheW